MSWDRVGARIPHCVLEGSGSTKSPEVGINFTYLGDSKRPTWLVHWEKRNARSWKALEANVMKWQVGEESRWGSCPMWLLVSTNSAGYSWVLYLSVVLSSPLYMWVFSGSTPFFSLSRQAYLSLLFEPQGLPEDCHMRVLLLTAAQITSFISSWPVCYCIHSVN